MTDSCEVGLEVTMNIHFDNILFQVKMLESDWLILVGHYEIIPTPYMGIATLSSTNWGT